MFGNLIALLVMAGAGAFLLWFGRLYLRASQKARERDQDIQARGVDAEAEIVNRRASTGRVPYFFITYQFTAQSQTITQESAIHINDYQRIKVGDHIALRYLPDNPKSVSLGSGIRETFGSASMYQGGMIMAVLGVGLIVAGIAMFIGFTASDNAKYATATAETLRLSATPDAAQKTATLRLATATAQVDQATVNSLSDKLSARIPGWKKVTDKVMHRVQPPETDLNMNEIEFDYGYCANGSFYLYVWLRITDRLNLGKELDTFMDGYGYVEASAPPSCYPKELSQVWLRNGGSLSNNWYAVSGAIEAR